MVHQPDDDDKKKKKEKAKESVEENDDWVKEANRIKQLAGIKTIEEAPADDCDCEVHEEHDDCDRECCDEAPVAEAMYKKLTKLFR